jgi:hypothetical protein
VNRARAAQTLVIFALLLPLVLLPVAAYAVQATLLATRASLLRAAATRAAEDAGEALDVGAFRSDEVLRLDPAQANGIARTALAEEDRAAELDDVTVSGLSVTVRAHDKVRLEFGGVLSAGSVILSTVATARLTAGYGGPSANRSPPDVPA